MLARFSSQPSIMKKREKITEPNGFIVARKDIEQFLIYDSDAGICFDYPRHATHEPRTDERERF